MKQIIQAQGLDPEIYEPVDKICKRLHNSWKDEGFDDAHFEFRDKLINVYKEAEAKLKAVNGYIYSKGRHRLIPDAINRAIGLIDWPKTDSMEYFDYVMRLVREAGGKFMKVKDSGGKYHNRIYGSINDQVLTFPESYAPVDRQLFLSQQGAVPLLSLLRIYQFPIFL